MLLRRVQGQACEAAGRKSYTKRGAEQGLLRPGLRLKDELSSSIAKPMMRYYAPHISSPQFLSSGFVIQRPPMGMNLLAFNTTSSSPLRPSTYGCESRFLKISIGRRGRQTHGGHHHRQWNDSRHQGRQGVPGLEAEASCFLAILPYGASWYPMQAMIAQYAGPEFPVNGTGLSLPVSWAPVGTYCRAGPNKPVEDDF